MLNPEKLRTTILALQRLLVAGGYETLERMTGGDRVTADEIRQAVEEWPARLVLPPSDAIDDLILGGEEGIYEVTDTSPSEHRLDVQLYTDIEGPSDLTLSIKVRENGGDLYDVVIEDLHVL